MEKQYKSVLAVTYLVITLFLWYFANNNLWYYLYNTSGFTTLGAFQGAIVSVISSLVFTYLLYGVFKIDKFNIQVSTLLVVIMAFMLVLSLIFFKNPLINGA